ncbi:MAG: Gfo/Idh/MocA family oxidoreductase [Bacteroidetes bacterium]|nr:Gfo/Idh/MocA family oxidoreductase [Bacteroidota bacterium]
MKFGILGDAKISRNQVIPAIRAAGHDLIQLGRRDPSVPSTDPIYTDVLQTDYAAVLANPDIDIIYNPLPNHLHVPWSVRALQAGKHVLCEKPAAYSMADLDKLEAATKASGKYFYEAYMIRHHPQWDWIANVDLGHKSVLHTAFTYPEREPGNIRNFAAFGGGPLLDIGCYAVMAGILIFGTTAPQSLQSVVVLDPAHDVDCMVSGLLIWPDNQHLTFTVASNAGPIQSLQLAGTKGYARLDIPFNPGAVATASLNRGVLGEDERISFPACNQYQIMIENVVSAIQMDSKPDFKISRIVTETLIKLRGNL